jgi:hypothetical protein
MFLTTSDLFGVCLAELQAAVEKELSPTQMKVARSRAQAMRPDLRRLMIAKARPEPLVSIVPLGLVSLAFGMIVTIVVYPSARCAFR